MRWPRGQSRHCPRLVRISDPVSFVDCELPNNKVAGSRSNFTQRVDAGVLRHSQAYNNRWPHFKRLLRRPASREIRVVG